MLFRSAVSPTFFNNTYRKSRVNYLDNSYSLFAFNPGWEKSGFEHLSRTVLSRFDADYKDNLKTLLLLFFTNILDCSQPDCGLRCRPFEVTCFFTADTFSSFQQIAGSTLIEFLFALLQCFFINRSFAFSLGWMYLLGYSAEYFLLPSELVSSSRCKSED